MLCAPPASSLQLRQRWTSPSLRLPRTAAADKADSFLSLGKSPTFPHSGDRYQRLCTARRTPSSLPPGTRRPAPQRLMTASWRLTSRPGEPCQSALRLLWLWCFVYAAIVGMHAAANYALLIGLLLPLIIMQIVCVLHVVNVLLYAR